jgi:hypothetical protein
MFGVGECLFLDKICRSIYILGGSNALYFEYGQGTAGDA